MPLFMDVHDKVEGLTAEAVAGAHAKDLEVQGQYGVDDKQYWSTRRPARCYASWRRPTPKPRHACTARHMDFSQTS